MKLPEEEEFEWKLKEESETDWDHGERPEKRSLEERIKNGMVLVDKPKGPTSKQVSAWVKKVLNIKKAGHSGTLDPVATGVLPVALDQATKISQALKGASKEYICLMKLNREVSKREASEEASRFVGKVKQIPPELSAVKREEREREIYYIDILETEKDLVLFKIGCERGFYVRNFCKDLGKALNTEGEMIDLRRTKVGCFKEEELNYLQDLKDELKFWKQGKQNKLDKVILPVEAGVRHLKKVIVKDSAVSALCHGANLGVQGISKLQESIEPGELVAILTLKGELIAIGNSQRNSEELLEEEKGTAVDLERVFMDKDVYPKEW